MLAERAAERLKERKQATSPTEEFVKYYDDPVGFGEHELGRTYSEQQKGILQSVRDHRFTAVKSGQKTGKTVSDADVALWWLATRPRGFVLLTSGSETQLRHTLWKELRWAHSKVKPRLGGDCKLVPQAGLQLPDGRAVIGVTTREYDPERFAGYSGDQLLIIIDEASRFPNELYEAARGNLMGGGHLLATSNPTRTSGWFFDAFNSSREGWQLHTLSSLETPNYKHGEDIIPGLASPEGVRALIDEWGEGSPVVSVRVHGEFAEHADDAVVGLGLVERAKQRQYEDNPEGRLTIGVDVAWYGDDDSVISPVRGLNAYGQTRIHGFDNVQLVERVKRVAAQLRKEGETPVIRIDTAGGWGSGPHDMLIREKWLKVVGVNVGENPKDRDKYHRKRDEVWFAAAKWLQDGGILPNDEKLSAELLAPRYGVDERGRTKVESKDAIKKRVGRSPDAADALCLAVYGGADADLRFPDVSKWPGSEASKVADIL